MLWVAIVGCGFLGGKDEIRDGLENKFRQEFAGQCTKEVGKAQVCSCVADELVARVPPKKLIGLTLRPKDAELQKIVAQVLKTCGAELVN